MALLRPVHSNLQDASSCVPASTLQRAKRESVLCKSSPKAQMGLHNQPNYECSHQVRICPVWLPSRRRRIILVDDTVCSYGNGQCSTKKNKKATNEGDLIQKALRITSNAAAEALKSFHRPYCVEEIRRREFKYH